ncbi:MAG: hypothetical protein GF411_14575 [Candidatus Lokiarchaeota archaeon]|nr:hypothetical protein [Candidatus Lokiarchaeota archaeon]
MYNLGDIACIIYQIPSPEDRSKLRDYILENLDVDFYTENVGVLRTYLTQGRSTALLSLDVIEKSGAAVLYSDIMALRKREVQRITDFVPEEVDGRYNGSSIVRYAIIERLLHSLGYTSSITGDELKVLQNSLHRLDIDVKWDC